MNQLVPSQQPSPTGGGNRWIYSAPLPAPSSEEGGSPVDISRLVTALRRRWWLVALLTISAGVAAWYQARHQPRVFHATAVVQLLDSHNSLAGDLVKDNEDRVPAMYMTLSEVEIIRSRGVAYVVVDSEPLGLRVNAIGFSNSTLSDVALDDGVSTARIPVTFRSRGTSIGSASGNVIPYGQPASLGGVHFIVTRKPLDVVQGSIVVTSRDRAVDRLIFDLDATPRKQTNLIDISYSSDDRATAKAVVNRVAKAYQTIDTQMAQQQLHRRRVFIEDQLARTDAQLAEADRALSTFRNEQHAYSSQDKFKAQQSAIVALDTRREELDGDRKMVRSLLNKFETGDDAARKSALSMLATAPEISDRSPVPDLYRKLLEYQRARTEMVSGPSGRAATHPEVQRFDTLIASTQSDLLSATRSYLTLLDSRVQALDEVKTRDASTLDQLPAAEATETRLQQTAEALRDQGATLRTEYQQARIAEAAELGQVEIVDLATRATGSQSSNRRFVAFALFLGFLLGGGIALLLEAADRTVKRRDDIEGSLRIPVLGTIPKIESNGDHKGGASPLTALTNGKPTATTRRRKVALTSVIHSRAPGAEAFRHLSTSLIYSPTGKSVRRILVTSPAEGDGKTSIASNLAITLANQRHRVLLVDCDMFGKLSSIFQLPASPGVSEVILEGMHPADVIRPTGIPGLSLMTAGKPPQNGSDIAGTERMGAMLREMTHEFDLVVLDCSPILALADSTILSVSADAVLLVVRAGHTAAVAAVEAMRQLSAVGAHVAGVVLNDPDDRARQYGSYYPSYEYTAK
ncbi:MAG: polysaccharide biosynthesis tyrosine autokinase [Gemmatimonadaceae bacterium]